MRAPRFSRIVIKTHEREMQTFPVKGACYTKNDNSTQPPALPSRFKCKKNLQAY